VNESDAVAMIDAYCPFTDDPALSSTQQTQLLALAVTVDADGVAPSEAGWTPTYSRVGCWRAIAEGWQIKAGLAAPRFDFTTDGQSFRRSQIMDHCEAMAVKYRRKLAKSTGSA
jgi:hypothetical protein